MIPELSTNSATIDHDTLMAADVINEPLRAREGSASGEMDFQTDRVSMPAKLHSLPPLNSIANRVLVISANPDCDIKRLAAVVEADPAFAGEVLFLANSPLFGFPSKIEVLHRAITVLGLDRMQALAMTVAMRAFVGDGGVLIRQCWRHSAACAVIAEKISPMFDLAGDQAYSAALMHDIGRLGLLKSYPREMAPVLGGSYENLDDVLLAEREAIQVDHEMAGAWLVKNWALPQSFAEVCRHHHDPSEPGDPALLQLIKFACKMADALQYSAVQYQPVASYQDLVSAKPRDSRWDRFPAEEALREYVKVRLAAFEQ